jgi:hypothetical protein
LKKSHYFSELSKSYDDEIDDLLTDSAGKSALQKRLSDKRRAFDALLPMIDFSPEMVAVVFYAAFDFSSRETMQQIVQTNPDRSDFPAWETLKETLTVADWAESLIVATLKTRGGDAFLVVSAALEFLRTNASAYEQKADKTSDSASEEGDDDENEDLGEAGAGWLSEQGFDTPER